MTVDEVMHELEESEDESGSESEDDFEGYLDEGNEDEQSGEEGSGESDSDDDMETEVSSIPPYTLHPGCSVPLSGNRPLDYFSLFVDDSTYHT